MSQKIHKDAFDACIFSVCELTSVLSGFGPRKAKPALFPVNVIL